MSVFLLVAFLQAAPDLPVRTKLQKPEEASGLWAYAFSPDAKLIAGSTGVSSSTVNGKKSTSGGEVLLWDAATGKIRKSLGKHGATPKWLRFSNDGKSLGSLSDEDGEFKLWDLVGGKLAQSLKLGTDTDAGEAAVAFDGKILVTVQRRKIPSGEEGLSYLFPGTLTARDPKTGKTLWKLDDSGVVVMGLSPDGKSLAAFLQKQVLEGGKPKITERRMVVLDAQTGKESKALELGDLGYASHLGFFPDGKTIFAYHYGELYRWDAQEGKPMAPLVGDKHEEAQALAFSPDGKTMGIVYFMGKAAEIRDLQANKRLVEVKTEPDELWHSAFTPDLKLIVCTRKFDPVLLSVPGLK